MKMRFKADVATNRELDNEYRRNDATTKFDVLTEMTKRINRHMITPDVVSIFRQYKLNGAGDQRF